MAEEASQAQAADTPTPADVANASERSDQSERSYTQADLDRIVKERLSRERAKYSDYNDQKAKAGEVDAMNAELAKAKERIEQLESEKQAAEHERELNRIRSDVAAKYGITDPSILVAGDSEEEIDAFAMKLMKVLKPYSSIVEGAAKVADPKPSRNNDSDFARALEERGW